MLGQILFYEGNEDMAVGVRPDTRVAIGEQRVEGESLPHKESSLASGGKYS